jgi:ParB-like chromosome segregation protein Spo0J
LLPLSAIYPSPENDRIYRPIDPADPELVALAASIRQHGVIEPIVVTLDGFILSGHRRYAAAELAGLIEIPCRVKAINRADDVARFVVLLREHNRQREKTNEERLREEIISINPD